MGTLEQVENSPTDSNSMDLEDAFSHLPGRQKAVLALRFAGYKQRDICELIGIARNTVWSDEKSALSALSNLLSPAIEGNS